MLFMQEHQSEIGFAESLKDLGDIPQVCQELIQQNYGMTPEEAALMFEQLWIQAYGLGSMCAMPKQQKQNAAQAPAGNGTGTLPSLLPKMQKRGCDRCQKAGDYGHKKCANRIKARRIDEEPMNL